MSTETNDLAPRPDRTLPPPPPPRGERANQTGGARWGRRFAFIASAVAIAVLFAFGMGSWFAPSPSPSTAGTPAATSVRTVPQPASATEASGTDVRAVASRVEPAVVDVDTTLSSFGQGVVGRAAGTGIVVTTGGEVLTNNHVIRNASTISVTVPGGGTYRAEVVGADPSADVALLQLQGAPNLPTATLADSSDLELGQEIVAIGNALGRGGAPSVTAGTITSLGRSIVAHSDVGGDERLRGLIQTNASISPGDSGGPLVNAAGQVVGMITAGAQAHGATSTHTGFAIPTDAAVSVVDRIESGAGGPSIVIGQPGYLGIEVAPLSAAAAARLGIDTRSGVVVAGELPSGPAARAGVRPSSVITAIDGIPVASIDALGAALHAHGPGEAVRVSWIDAGGSHAATVRLISGPAV